jgi:hypothetical protein
MARQTIEILTDDLDGNDAAETIRFGLDGVDYEIDLTRANASTLRKSLNKYVKAGRRVGGRKVRGAGRAPAAGRRDYDLADLRAWAAKKRIKVPARGRIPHAVVERYKADAGR